MSFRLSVWFCNQSSHWRYVSYDSMSICMSDRWLPPRAPGLTSGLQGSVNVHCGALLLVPQWRCISSFVFYIQMLLSHVTFSRHLYLEYENHLAPYFRYSVWFSVSKVMLHIWQHNHMQPVSLHQRTSELRTRIPSINNFAATARRPANNISKISDVHITS